MDRIVHIYTDHGPISILLAALKGAKVLFGLFLLFQAFSRGEAGQVLWGGLALIAGGAFFGGYDLIKLLDHSPQLTLGPEGFVDHRVAVPVVIAWDHFGSLGYRGRGASGWTLEIFVTDGGHVLVPASHLAVTPKELVRLGAGICAAGRGGSEVSALVVVVVKQQQEAENFSGKRLIGP